MPREKRKAPFPVWRWKILETGFHFKQKQEPMTTSLIAMLADNPRQVQIRGCDRQPKFLLSLSAGTGIRRFPLALVQFAAAGTPQSQVRFLGPFHQQDFVGWIETVE